MLTYTSRNSPFGNKSRTICRSARWGEINAV
ncbi:hypothetical protein VCHC56A2_2925, partial [Vibrio cholerae HC-56A2]